MAKTFQIPLSASPGIIQILVLVFPLCSKDNKKDNGNNRY